MNFRRAMLAIAFSALAFGAQAQSPIGARAINTGSAAGAYHSTFCPPIPRVLANAYFQGYQCTESVGTLQNIERVLATPTNIGFVQFDVFAREASRRPELSRLQVVRADIACEGLWMVTRNPDLDFGRVLGLSRRIRWVLPPAASGSTASFNYLRSIDPEGLGRAPDSNITHMNSATDVIRNIAASTDGSVGFFVQFADPRNANIKLMVEQGLRVIPVISREILRARVGETSVYQAQTFSLSEGSFLGIGGRAQTATTACTQVALITGAAEAFSDRNARDDATEMTARLRSVPASDLMPQDGVVSRILRQANRLSQSAVDAAVEGVETARRAVVER